MKGREEATKERNPRSPLHRQLAVTKGVKTGSSIRVYWTREEGALAPNRMGDEREGEKGRLASTRAHVTRRDWWSRVEPTDKSDHWWMATGLVCSVVSQGSLEHPAKHFESCVSKGARACPYGGLAYKVIDLLEL